MSVDLNLPDGTEPELAAELPPEVATRFEDLETRTAPIPEIASRLDRIETRLSRPSAARIEVKEDPQAETKAFTTWCRKGWDGLSDIERKVLTAAPLGSPVGTDGWQTVPQQFVAELIRNLVEVSPMRQVARVMQVSGTPVLLPKRTGIPTANWIAETQEHGLSEPAYEQQQIPVFEARVSTEITNQLLEDSAFDLAAELARDLGESFGVLESAAFVGGDGVTSPEGFLVSDDWTVLTATGVTADNLIDLYHSIPSRYASRGTWLLRRETAGEIRKLRSAEDGPYIWSDSLQPGDPPSLLGRPVVEFPDLAVAGQSPVEPVLGFGDWNRAYRVVDRVGLEILRDPYSAARNSIVTFHARRRTGGALVDGAAVKGLTA